MQPCVLLEEPRGWGNWLIAPLAPLILLLVRCFAGTLECPQSTRMPFATLKKMPLPLSTGGATRHRSKLQSLQFRAPYCVRRNKQGVEEKRSSLFIYCCAICPLADRCSCFHPRSSACRSPSFPQCPVRKCPCGNLLLPNCR